MPRSNTKPYAVYAEMGKAPGLYLIDKYVEPGMADGRAVQLRSNKAGRIVLVRHIKSGPIEHFLSPERLNELEAKDMGIN